ncbi:MAG: V-type ATP synthase subunit I [Bacillota bacterium]
MAIVQMKRMKLVALSEEKEEILNILNKLNCVELKETQEIENTHTRFNEKRASRVSQKLSKLNFAIELIAKEQIERGKLAAAEVLEYTKPKKAFMAGRTEVEFERFINSDADEIDIMAKVSELENLQNQKSEIKGKLLKIDNTIASLAVYQDLQTPFSKFKSTKNVAINLGTIPVAVEMKFDAELEKGGHNFVVEKISKVGDYFSIFAYAHKEFESECSDFLSEFGFSKCAHDFDDIPSEKVQSLKAEIETLKARDIELNGYIVGYENHLDKMKQLFDFFTFKYEKISAQGGFKRTKGEKVVAFESWVPTEKIEDIQQAVGKYTDRTYFEFQDAAEDDIPPTLALNNKLVSNFEVVTNMYSAPSYREADPNFSVMIFFFVFFGFMLSDAGYGLLLAVGGWAALKFLDLEKGTKQLATVIALGGISTIIWGVLFGGYFGVDVSETFLGNFTWFTPLDNPIGVLALSLGLGMFQILWGMGLNAIALWKAGRKVDAICDVGSWYVLFFGIMIYALSMVPGFEFVASAGMYLAIAGVAMLILTQGRAEKNILMKGFKGIASLYGIMNYVSDILSYARLFGLGLATGVVGMVMNEIGIVFIDLIPYAGWVIGIAFILAGHCLNIGINVLGAYVHDCRLQYIEFFGKFYEGGGHVFRPFGSNTKYIRIKNNK